MDFTEPRKGQQVLPETWELVTLAPGSPRSSQQPFSRVLRTWSKERSLQWKVQAGPRATRKWGLLVLEEMVDQPTRWEVGVAMNHVGGEGLMAAAVGTAV